MKRALLLWWTVGVTTALAPVPGAATPSARSSSTVQEAATSQATYTPRPKGSVTYSEHIAPLLFKHCTPCHRSGQTGPFPLTTYQEARRRGRLIGMASQDRFMPPWLPEEGYGEFANSRALTAEEIGLIMQWSRDRTPPGNLDDAPPLPDFSQAWDLGPPDLVLEASEGFEMPADTVGITRNFVFPVDLAEDRWIRAVALKPSSNTVLRALLFIDPSGSTKDVGPTDLGAVLATPSSKGLGFAPLPGLGGEIVETSPWPYPEGTAQLLPKGSSVLLQVYFEPTGEVETERPELGFYFAAQPPTRTLVTASLGTRSLEIPAGESEHHIKGSFTLPVETEVVGVIPHAHRVASELQAWATLPDGTKQWLFWIKKWDFTWQQPYWLKKPLALPAGSVLEMDYRYDNTDDNANNPNYPAQPMTWDPTLKGEMAGLHVRMIVKSKKDLSKLDKAYRGYLKAGGL